MCHKWAACVSLKSPGGFQATHAGLWWHIGCFRGDVFFLLQKRKFVCLTKDHWRGNFCEYAKYLFDSNTILFNVQWKSMQIIHMFQNVYWPIWPCINLVQHNISDIILIKWVFPMHTSTLYYSWCQCLWSASKITHKYLSDVHMADRISLKNTRNRCTSIISMSSRGYYT